MKKTIFTAIAVMAILLISSCVSSGKQNSPEWAGIYHGVIPAADCPGISVVVILTTNHTYKITNQYIDRGDGLLTYTGVFRWDEKSKTITLNSTEPSTGAKNEDSGVLIPDFKLRGQYLLYLDHEGKEITGQLADNYKLKRL